MESIKIKGGCFKEETDMPNLLKNNITVVYGKNGSGKSTIARGIYQSAEAERNIPEVIVDYGFELDEKIRSKIFVYNEDFIEKTVKIQPKGLKTMVMLGEQAKLNEELAKKKVLKQKTEEDVGNINKKIEDINRRIKEELKIYRNELNVSKGWAENDRKLRRRRVNSPITEKLVEEMFRINQNYDVIDLEQLRKEIEEGVAVLGNEEGGKEINIYYKEYEATYNVNGLLELCRRKIERHALTERDKKIIEILSSKYNYLGEAREYFSDENYDICPYCFREIDAVEKEKSCKLISSYLEKEEETYRAKLTLIYNSITNIEEIKEDDVLYKLFSELYQKARAYRIEINKSLLQTRDIIKNRIENLYGDFGGIVIPDITEQIKSYNSILRELNIKIHKINEDVKEGGRKIECLIQQNLVLASHEQKNRVASIHKLMVNLEHSMAELGKKKSELINQNQSINEIIAQIKNTKIPADLINEMLSFVYFDATRLSLKQEGAIYKLLVNGEEISPNKVSVGERNAIALSYFFASIGENKHKVSMYDEPSLIVLDDPVSSFDYDNRVGILSALRWQIHTALNKCRENRFLILSHDLTTVQDLSKLTNDVLVSLNRDNRNGNARKCSREYFCLHDYTLNCVDKKNIETLSVYGQLIKRAYQIASSDSASENIAFSDAGNVLRKILEAYSTFVYRKGPSEIMQDEMLGLDPEHKKFYQNCMARLILNSDSHMADDARALVIAFGRYENAERIKIAKIVLMFLNTVNPLHLKAYLPPEHYDVVKSWTPNSL